MDWIVGAIVIFGVIFCLGFYFPCAVCSPISREEEFREDVRKIQEERAARK